MSSLEKLICELLENKIPITGVSLYEESEGKWKSLSYEISGFSKSGTVQIFQTNSKLIYCKARYNEMSEIYTFEDIARIAFDWYKRYKDSSMFSHPNSNWLPHFIKFGWITPIEKTITEYIL